MEHIVLDGGSTDGSTAILQAWSETHPIRWSSSADDGQAAAIQSGIAMAEGDVVTWLNSDDVYLAPTVLSDVVRLFDAGARVVTGGGWYLTDSGDKLEEIPVRTDRLTFSQLRRTDWILQPATFIRKSLLDTFPIDIQLNYAFDWDLFIRLSQAVQITPIEKPLAGYRLHSAAKTVGRGSGRQHEVLAVARRYNARLSPHYLLLLGGTVLSDLVGLLPAQIQPPLHRAILRAARILRPSPRPRTY